MKTTRLMLLALCSLLLINLLACSGGKDGGDNLPPDFTVTVSPLTASVAAGDNVQFTATVLNPVNNGVAWSVSGAGCSGDACGTIAQGLYTAPAVVPSPPTVSVRATSRDDTGKSAAATVTITAAITVSVSPLAANVAVNGTQQFTAVVQNTTNTAVNWTVAGEGCTGAACGTISATGLYTAPAAVPDPPTVTVTATSQADTRKKATATVTVGGSALGRLSGSYAFLLSGFDADGPMHTAGRFQSDGSGHLINGVQDVNRRSGVSSQVAFTGTYNLGADSRGELVFTSSLGTSRFRFALNADATEARVIEFDDTGTRCSGVFLKQDAVAFTPAIVQGDYVLSFTGAGVGGRTAAVGKFHADGVAGVREGLLDINDGSASPPATAAWTGSYTVDADGSGTMTANVSGLGTFHFRFYIVATDHHFLQPVPYLLFASVDPLAADAPLLNGQAWLTPPTQWTDQDLWSSTSLIVFALAGRVPEGGARAIAGTFGSDAAGHLQNGLFDQNRAGVISGGAASDFSATYHIEPNGRGTATLQLTATETLALVFYMVTQDRAVLLGTPGSDVLAGYWWGMGGGGAPNDNSVFSGDYVSGPLALPSPGAMFFTGVLHADGINHFDGTQDISFGTGLNSPGELIAGIYAYGVRGRASATLAGGGDVVLYMLSLDAELAISVDPDDAHPVILFIRR